MAVDSHSASCRGCPAQHRPACLTTFLRFPLDAVPRGKGLPHSQAFLAKQSEFEGEGDTLPGMFPQEVTEALSGQQPRWGRPDVKLPVSWHQSGPHASLKARGGASAQQALSERLLSVSTVGDKTVWEQTWGQRDERRWKERAEVDPGSSGQGDSAQQNGVTPGQDRQEAAGPLSVTPTQRRLCRRCCLLHLKVSLFTCTHQA